MTTDPHDSTGVSEGKLYENLRRLISVVDDLRDVGLQKYINLPRIVVVGTQSGGKSSVLESIVGIDFLPRGDGVVTRRPLELRLVHVPESDASRLADAWAVFGALPDKIFTNFDQVRDEINRQTDLVAGKNKGIIDDPIVLNVYSTTCPRITAHNAPHGHRAPVDNAELLHRSQPISRAGWVEPTHVSVERGDNRSPPTDECGQNVPGQQVKRPRDHGRPHASVASLISDFSSMKLGTEPSHRNRMMTSPVRRPSSMSFLVIARVRRRRVFRTTALPHLAVTITPTRTRLAGRR